jgi:hypothetical protein
MGVILFNRGRMLALAASTLACTLFGGRASAANLLANPGFETGASAGGGDIPGAAGWSSFDNAYTTSSPNPAPVGPHSGVGSLKMFSSGVAGVFQTFPATPGEVFNFNADGLALTSDQLGGGNFALLKVVWLNSSGAGLQPVANDPNLIGTDETDGNPGITSAEITANTGPGTWLPYTAQGTAPAGTAQVQVLDLFVNVGGANGNGQSGAVWYDDESLSQVSVPEPVTLSALGMVGLPLLMRRRRSRA